jgi:hypothetical protein
MESSEYDQSNEISESSESKEPKEKISRKISIRSVRFEKIIPLFTGLMGSLIVCTIIAAQVNVFIVGSNLYDESALELRQENTGSFFLSVSEPVIDPIMEYYRNPEFQDWVVGFFANICSSEEIARTILQYADEFNVPAALAFALSWEESRFNPNAVNRHNRDGSIDRGLFQLNNRSFPNLELNSFFDINTNVRYGISHLQHCLNVGGTEVSALAIYNAGAGRVNSTGTPRVTLNYISRILNNRSKIETRFHTFMQEEEARIADAQRAQLQLNRTLISASPQ